MKRIFSFLLIAAMISTAAYTFKLKHETLDARAKLDQIEREIIAERNTIELLETDWSFLTQPGRLQDLTERYNSTLELQPISVDQIIALEELPNRPIDLSPYNGANPLGGYAGGSENNIQ